MILSEEEYKKLWESGLYNTDYNNCKFSEDKIKYGIEWLKARDEEINIESPQTLQDRICYNKFYDKDIRKQKWSDKINVLNELKNIGLEELIIKPILVKRGKLTFNDIKDIPNGKYILKCNHGSGWNFVFNKTDSFNPSYMIDVVNEWLGLNFTYISGYEWQYENIKPGFIIQEYLGNLLDWNFWCENGEIKYVHLVKKISKNLEEFIASTDGDGNVPDKWVGNKPLSSELNKRQKEILNIMKPYVLKLCSDYKFVRVDLYYVNNKVYFGELTFTPCSGLIKFLTVNKEK